MARREEKQMQLESEEIIKRFSKAGHVTTNRKLEKSHFTFSSTLIICVDKLIILVLSPHMHETAET
jgi:hypothetical protein